MATDETYIREAIELAQASVAAGNTPFGSLLVVDDTIVKRAENTTKTANDITAHPELKLARWAARELSATERAQCTMYTSTEPCEMCAAAIHYAELDRVVYSVASASVADLRDHEHSGISCVELIDRKGGSTTVDGPVCESDGLAVHEAYY